MLMEMIQEIVSLGRESRAPYLIDKRRTALHILPSGEQVEVLKIPMRCSHFDEPVSFVEAVKHYGDDNVSIWITGGKVVAVLDETYRDDRLELLLPDSNEFARLLELPDGFTQRQLIRWLTLNFDEVDHLIQPLRRVDFRRRSDGTSVVEHGKESLGRSVESAVQGVEEIPSRVTIEVPRWSVQGLRRKHPIELCVDIDASAEKFELSCGPNELDIVASNALEQLQTFLAGELAPRPVFLGAP